MSPDHLPLLLGLLKGEGFSRLPPSRPEHDFWEGFLQAASRNALIPLIRPKLESPEMEGRVPTAIMETMKEECAKLAARRMVLADELRHILAVFESGGIFCAPMRGLALSERLHGHGLRPMGDIDLMVRREDVRRLPPLFADMGYSEMDRRPGFARAYSYSLEFFKDRLGWTIVEPHWTIAYPPFSSRLDMEPVWRRCVRASVCGIRTWSLGAEDLALHLCLHAAHRGKDAPLLWFYELGRLLELERGAFDWDVFMFTVRGAGLEPVTAPALRKTKDWMDAPVPDSFLRSLENGAASRGGLSRLVAESPLDGSESLAAFFAIPGALPKLRYALSLLFPSPRFMKIEYGLTGPWQISLGYAKRLAYLASEAMKGVLALGRYAAKTSI